MPLGLIQYTLAIVSTSQCMIAIAVLLCPRSAIRDSVNQEETCRDVLVGQKPLLLATKKGPGFRVSASHLWCWLERRCRNYPDSDIIIPQPAGEVHKPPPQNPESSLPSCFLELCRQTHKAPFLWQSRKKCCIFCLSSTKRRPNTLLDS